jgi:hypothetical protein
MRLLYVSKGICATEEPDEEEQKSEVEIEAKEDKDQWVER